MTPKEKAKELYEKYFYSIAGCCISDKSADKAATSSALICVDEMLETLEPTIHDHTQKIYLLEVKKEIKAL